MAHPHRSNRRGNRSWGPLQPPREQAGLDLAGVAARLATGDALGSPAVEHRRARRVRVRSAPGMPFNADGELITRTACTFDVVPRALRVLVPA